MTPEHAFVPVKGQTGCARCGYARGHHPKSKIHFRSIRLLSNAGMSFPVCYARADVLDLDKGRLPTTGDIAEVTCKKCLRGRVR